MEHKTGWFIGECMVELRKDGQDMLHQSFAGDVFNTAVYFHRAAPSWQTCFVSMAGNDQVSQALLEYAHNQGVNTQWVGTTARHPPGIYWIHTDSGGERSFIYWRNDSAARQMLDAAQIEALQQNVAQCSLIYFSGITLAILDDTRRERLLALARQVKHAGGWVGFDTNYRPGLWREQSIALHWINAALAATTHALVTFEDEHMLHHDATPSDTMSRTLARGPHEVVVKMGQDGCLVQAGSNAELQIVPAEKVVPVDTTAAGDSFNAAYLAARLHEENPVEAAYAGSRLAARVIQFPGAIIENQP